MGTLTGQSGLGSCSTVGTGSKLWPEMWRERFSFLGYQIYARTRYARLTGEASSFSCGGAALLYSVGILEEHQLDYIGHRVENAWVVGNPSFLQLIDERGDADVEHPLVDAVAGQEL